MLVEREAFWAALKDSRKGCDCPVCDRFAKIYNRKLNSSMVRALLWFYAAYVEAGQADWIHVSTQAPRWMIISGEFAKLKFWRFLAEQRNDDPVKRDSGCWRLTQKGLDFAEGKITANARVITYNDSVLEWDTTQVSVQRALGRHYHYAEIMNTSPCACG